MLFLAADDLRVQLGADRVPGTHAMATPHLDALANRSLFIRVRDGAASPIKTFETTGTLGSAGGSSTAIRTSDA